MSNIKPINMDTATLQEMVDYSVQKIVEQGGRCFKGVNGVCAYSDGRGRHCAVGWLLDHDNENLLSAEGTLGEILDNFGGVLPAAVIRFKEQLELLQEFHDGAYQSQRRDDAVRLQQVGINTKGEWFQAWVNMGEK